MQYWDAVWNVGAGGFSVVCMSSMGAALAAAGAAGGAGAVGMAGMGAMGAGEPLDGPSAFFLLPRLFQSIGLGFLNQVPNALAQPLLAALLGISAVTAYLAYRGHRRLPALILTVASAIIMYLSIYVWMSEALYFLSLAGLLATGLWGVFLARGTRLVPPERP